MDVYRYHVYFSFSIVLYIYASPIPISPIAHKRWNEGDVGVLAEGKLPFIKEFHNPLTKIITKNSVPRKRSFPPILSPNRPPSLERKGGGDSGKGKIVWVRGISTHTSQNHGPKPPKPNNQKPNHQLGPKVYSSARTPNLSRRTCAGTNARMSAWTKSFSAS